MVGRGRGRAVGPDRYNKLRGILAGMIAYFLLIVIKLALVFLSVYACAHACLCVYVL